MIAPASAPVPHLLGDIDANWLEQLIRPRHPAARIEQLTVVDAHDGTCSRVRLRARGTLDGLEQTDLALFLKTCFEDNPFAEKNRQNGRVRNEARIYAELLPTSPVPHPALHGWAVSADGDRAAFVTDDLQAAGARWGHASQPLSGAQASVILGHLAAFHARWWGDPSLVDLTWLPTPHHDPDPASRLRWVRPGLSRLRSGLAGSAPESMSDDDRLLEALMRVTAHASTRPMTLLHGDPHIGNFAFVSPLQPVLTDWAVHRGRWVADVSYLLTSSLTVEERRSTEVGLLRDYLAALAARGVEPPPFNEAWAEYRAQALYGLLVWLPVRPHMQPDEVVSAYTQRQLAACTDLDSMAAAYDLPEAHS